MALIDQIGKVPYDSSDTTRNWIETTPGMRVNGKVKPNLLVRYATDNNYVRNDTAPLYPGVYQRNDGQTRSIMNLSLPGQQVFHIMNWAVNEDATQTTQTASIDMVNALGVSTTRTTLTTPLGVHTDTYGNPIPYDNTNIQASWVQSSLGTIGKVNGNVAVNTQMDPTTNGGFYYFEDKVQYRQFASETFGVASPARFPDPSIPNDDDNDVPSDATLPASSTGVGSYYVLIDKEVVRVYWLSGSTFYILPGGRAINGIIQSHSVGAPVTLLGYGDLTGDFVAMGYLNLDDYNVQKAFLRPGTCLVSYEGYGDFPTLMSHQGGSNYAFTGYWFVNGVEPSIAEDGIPKIHIDLKSAGNIYDQQKITPDLVQRIKSNFGQWNIRDRGNPEAPPQSIFGSANHTRNIPGDWVDFNSWDPSLPDSYPLTVSIELAQHQDFYNHMTDTQLGLTCPICQQERRDFIEQHPNNPQGNIKENRAIGKHIYKESIRVAQDEAGPLLTYIRLMGTLAAAGWEHPALGLELAQKFCKLPGKLYDNVRNINTGLCFNGQVDFQIASDDADFDWTTPTYNDSQMFNNRIPLTCPFKSQYDKAAFSQPMLDLAAVNGAQFWVDREGYPVFVPMNFSFRPNGSGYRDLQKTIPFTARTSQWFMRHGSSINGYSSSLNIDSILTQVWVTGTTAFDSDFTTTAGGTGWSKDGKRILYSALGGNEDGLSMTSGVQQVDTVTMDNLILGFDWNTQPANWGLQQQTQNGIQVIQPRPQLYHGATSLNVGDRGKAVHLVQRTINYFLTRFYIDKVQDPEHPDKWWYQVPDDGRYSKVTAQGVLLLKYFLNSRSDIDYSGLQSLTFNGQYGQSTYQHLNAFFSQAANWIKIDVWWYVYSGMSWNEYVAAITGVPVIMQPSGSPAVTPNNANYLSTPQYVIDDVGMQNAVNKWQGNFTRNARYYGDRIVDKSINEATQRSIQVGIADPRIQPCDVIWCTVPGYLEPTSNPPFNNGIYVQTLDRAMDLQNMTYTATYTGTRYRGEFGNGLSTDTSPGYRFIA